MKPKILLSGKLKMQYYVDAVNASGGDGHIEYCPEPDLDYDGLIICGGSDIDPKYYGEDINGAVNIDEKRDTAEFLLVKEFYDAGKPIMGICRGMQLLNIFFGGSLYQHIGSADMHTVCGDADSVHKVSATEGSIFERIYGKSFYVNSAHHEAVKLLGKDLGITLISDDITEAFEHKTAPIFGVQWHPERMCCSQKREDTADGLKIFEYFVELCKKHGNA